MKKILIPLFIALAALACDRTLESEGLGFDTPEEPPTPVGVKIFHLADGIRLAWQIGDSTENAYFNVYYNSEAVDSDYILWDSTSAFSLDITTLGSGQAYYFKVSNVTDDGVESILSEAVSTSIGVSAVTINNDDEYAQSPEVALYFVVPVQPLLVQRSEDETFTGAIWFNYAQPLGFTLSDGDGVKKVYARFRFSDGSESSAPVSDSIILDTRAAIDSVYFTADSSHLLAGDTVTFFLDAGEIGGEASVSFPGVNNLDLFDDGTSGDETADDGVYSRLLVIPIDMEVTDGYVAGRFTDAAGNEADPVTGSERLNVVILPDEITLRTVAENSLSIRLEWSETDADGFLSYRIYRDSDTGSVDETSELVTIITSRTIVSYNDDELDDDTFYAYRVYVYGVDGLITRSNGSGVTTLVNSPPATVNLAVAVGLVDELSVDLTWTASTADDFASYRIYRGPTDAVDDVTGQRLAIINDRATTGFTDHRSSVSETFYYVIYVYDQQGLKSPRSNPVATP